MDPAALRQRCREGTWAQATCGQCPGYAQANLVMLPRKYAADFRKFCELNPKSCPLVEILDGPFTKIVANGADVRKDLPLYNIYRYGKLTQANVTDVEDVWIQEASNSTGQDGRDGELVTFLIGCSFSFETALENAGLPVRHIDEGVTVPMYRTNIDTVPVGLFQGKLVVSMRPYLSEQVARVTEITAQFPQAHGGPVHVGSPEQLGIMSISEPDYGMAVTIKQGEVPMFWMCGVTPQVVLTSSTSIPICITHVPGCMLVCDVLNDEPPSSASAFTELVQPTADC